MLSFARQHRYCLRAAAECRNAIAFATSSPACNSETPARISRRSMVCEASASGSRRWFNSCGYGRGPTTDPARRRGRLNHSYRRFCRSGGCMGSGHRRARHRGDRWAAHLRLSDVESHSFARFAVRRASTSYPLQLGQNLLRVPVQHRPTGSVHWPFMTRRGSETRGVKREVDDVELPGRFRPLLWIGSMRAGAGSCPRSLIIFNDAATVDCCEGGRFRGRSELEALLPSWPGDSLCRSWR